MKDEFDDWARAVASDARVRAMWIAEFKAEGYRIVKLREADNYMDDETVFIVEEEL